MTIRLEESLRDFDGSSEPLLGCCCSRFPFGISPVIRVAAVERRGCIPLGIVRRHFQNLVAGDRVFPAGFRYLHDIAPVGNMGWIESLSKLFNHCAVRGTYKNIDTIFFPARKRPAKSFFFLSLRRDGNGSFFRKNHFVEIVFDSYFQRCRRKSSTVIAQGCVVTEKRISLTELSAFENLRSDGGKKQKIIQYTTCSGHPGDEAYLLILIIFKIEKTVLMTNNSGIQFQVDFSVKVSVNADLVFWFFFGKRNQCKLKLQKTFCCCKGRGNESSYKFILASFFICSKNSFASFSETDSGIHAVFLKTRSGISEKFGSNNAPVFCVPVFKGAFFKITVLKGRPGFNSDS